MNHYILSFSAVNGDDMQVRCFNREDILHWLRKVDHEGSQWGVVSHDMDGDVVMETTDITDEIRKEYEA